VPWFSKDGKLSYSTINARAEGVRTNASYKDPFLKRRCLVPASGYFEWTGEKGDKQPHYFTRADGKPMAFAGLWDRWRSKDKSETKETFTIVTTAPSKFASQWHDRMPLILEPDMWDAWLRGDADTAAALMRPANEDALVNRLLIVDDELDITQLVEAAARELGFEVLAIHDTDQFETALETIKPTIIFLDILMPGRDGVELIRNLGAGNYPGRVVIMSGANPAYVQMGSALARAAGLWFAGTLFKPFRKQDAVDLLISLAMPPA